MMRDRARCWLTWTGLLLLSGLLLPGLTSVAQAQSKTSAPKTELALSHTAPADCVFFATWNGWSAPDPDSTNNTEKLLAEPSLQEFVQQLGDEVAKQLLNSAKGDPKAAEAIANGTRILKSLATHPGSIYVGSVDASGPTPVVEAALVIDFENDAADARGAIDTLLSLDPRAASQLEVVTVAGIELRQLKAGGPQLVFGFVGSKWIVCSNAQTVESLLPRLKPEAKQAEWLAGLSKSLAVERPSSILHINISRLVEILTPVINQPEFPEALKASGFGQLKHYTAVSGLDAKGLQTRSILALDGPATGLLAAFPNKPLTLESVARIPGSAAKVLLARFDLAKLIDGGLATADAINPMARAQFEDGLTQVEQSAGFHPGRDLIAALGDEWMFYTSGTEGAGATVPAFVMACTVKDPEGLRKVQASLVGLLKQISEAQGDRAPFSVGNFTAHGEKGFRIQLKQVPMFLPVVPTWVLTNDQLVIGIMPQLVSAHLNPKKKSTLADIDEVKAAFERNPTPVVLTFNDPKPGLTGIYTLVNGFGPLLMNQLAQTGVKFTLPPLPPIEDITQHLRPSVTATSLTDAGWVSDSRGVVPGMEASPAVIAVGVALLLPAVQQARSAARRTQEQNDLKQVALAMHNYHDTHNAFPPQASRDAAGQPLLSWRVLILPYLDQAELYKEFHLDEPWDSPHNKPLITKMPKVYASSFVPQLESQGQTLTQMPRGKGQFGEGKDGLKIASITDGTSNTLMTVDTAPASAVIWTKPDDIQIDLTDPLAPLRNGVVPNGFVAGFADGSVRFIAQSIDPEVLALLLQIADGTPIPSF